MNDLQIIELHKDIKYSFDNEIKEKQKSIDNTKIDDKIVKKIKKLRSYGFENFDYSRVLRGIENNENIINEIEEMRKKQNKYYGYKILTYKSIEEIKEKYNLFLGRLVQYTAEVPFNTIKKLDKFFKLNKDAREINLMILAPHNKFNEKAKHLKKEDPILMYQDASFFIVIHAWGFEKELIKNV